MSGQKSKPIGLDVRKKYFNQKKAVYECLRGSRRTRRHIQHLIAYPGVQYSFRCLVADILCLAKRVNRNISAKCDKARKLRHFSQMPPATCHLPPTTCYHFSSLKKRAWQNIKLQHLSHLPPATTHLPPATCHQFKSTYMERCLY